MTFVAASLSFLGSQVAAEEFMDRSADILSQDDLERLVTIVTADFLDPSAAQFRGLEFSEVAGGERFVCGFVNGKDSYGAYVGFSPFYFDVENGESRVATYADLSDDAIGPLTKMVFEVTGCNAILGL